MRRVERWWDELFVRTKINEMGREVVGFWLRFRN